MKMKNSTFNIFELYFENIACIYDLIEAEHNGFTINFKTARPEMPGASLLHEAARKCLRSLIEHLIIVRKMDINALDEDACTPLGYVLNDDLWQDCKGRSLDVTTVNNGCEEANLIINTIEFLVANGAKCIYNGEEYSHSWIKSYLISLKKNI
jgi:hypothetical protein